MEFWLTAPETREGRTFECKSVMGGERSRGTYMIAIETK